MLIVLYADDTAILADSSENLQRGLDILKLYCDTWKLKVNVDKTKIAIFERRKSIAQNLIFRYDGEEIEITPTFSYLVINLSSNGKMKDCIGNLLDRGRKAMFVVLKKAREQNLSPDIQIDLFHKLVLPILSYRCEFWANEDLDRFDKFHKKILRYVLRLNTSTPIPMIYGETGEIPISIVLKSRMVGYMCKLLNPNTSTLSQQVSGVVLNMHNGVYYTTKWLYKVVSLPTKIGHADVLQNRNYVPPKVLSQIYKAHAKEVFVNSWRNRMSNLSKCDMYHIV